MSKDKIRAINSILKKEYGRVEFRFYGNPLDELIVTVLSQNTTWQNCRRAYANLRRLGPWEKLLKMPVGKIAGAIRVGGLGNVKAHTIKEVLEKIRERTGRLSLSFLRNEKTRDALDFLRSLRGVGPKTAAVVALFSLRRPVFPVDTHILRLTKRLGLIPQETTLAKAHELLGALMPQKTDAIMTAHINMIAHGRKICRPGNPRCGECALRRHCDYYRRKRRRIWN